MGYELESAAPPPRPDADGDPRLEALERRWHVANDRLAAALAGYRELRGQAASGDPAWIAAQLRVAQARQRCREAGEALELAAQGTLAAAAHP
jgi:hypothetical protein